VRLRSGYFVTCTGVDKDATGAVTAIHCTYDPATKGGNAPDGRKVKATIHWVSAAHAVDAEVRLYEHLFTHPDPASADGGDFLKLLNPHSEKVVRGKLEPSLGVAEGRRALPVRAHRLLLLRHQGQPGRAGVLAHGRAEGQLPEGAEEGRQVGPATRPGSHQPRSTSSDGLVTT
jgi:hypothetical protein